MFIHETQKNKSQEVASSLSNLKINSKAAFQLVDNRPRTIAQMKIKEQQDKFEPIQKKSNNTGLPDQLKSGIENLSGHSMDDVKVHYNSDKPAQLNAHAYAQGSDIHLASGQEKHLPHEAWHVVQQKQGRVKPTVQMKRKVNVNDDAGLEHEADIMGAKAFQFIDNRHSIVAQRKLLKSPTAIVVQRVLKADEIKVGSIVIDDESKEKFEVKKIEGEVITISSLGPNKEEQTVDISTWEKETYTLDKSGDPSTGGMPAYIGPASAASAAAASSDSDHEKDHEEDGDYHSEHASASSSSHALASHMQSSMAFGSTGKEEKNATFAKGFSNKEYNMMAPFTYTLPGDLGELIWTDNPANVTKNGLMSNNLYLTAAQSLQLGSPTLLSIHAIIAIKDTGMGIIRINPHVTVRDSKRQKVRDDREKARQALKKGYHIPSKSDEDSAADEKDALYSKQVGLKSYRDKKAGKKNELTTDDLQPFFTDEWLIGMVRAATANANKDYEYEVGKLDHKYKIE